MLASSVFWGDMGLISQRKVGAILGYANIIVKNLVNLVYTPMLLAFVGQADYGVFQTANSFVFSLTLLTFGSSNAYIRFYTSKKEHGTEEDVRNLNGIYLAIYIAISAVALALGLLLARNVGMFFSSSFTSEEVGLAGTLMTIMAVNVAATLLSTVFDAYVMAHEQFKFRQTRQMFTTLATPGIAFILLNLGMGVVGVALAQLVVTLTLFALNVRFAVLKLGMRFSLRRFDRALFRAMAAFSGWIFINQVCDLVNQSVPNILLGALTNAATVSVFAVSIQIRNVFISLSTVISSVFIPKINRIVATSDDNVELTHLMTRVGRYQMVLFCWVYGGFVVLGRFFVERWAGTDFADVYWLVLVMTAPLAIPLAQNTGIEIQRAKNMHRTRSVAMLLMAGLNVVVTVVASPAIGYWAPAIGYVAGIALCNGAFMNWYYQRRVGLDMLYFWRRNLPVLFAGVVITAVCLAGTMVIPVSGWPTFFAWGAAYSIFFAFALWFAVFTRGERAAVASRLPFFR